MEISPNSKSLFNYFNTYKAILGLLLYSLVLSNHAFLQQFRSVPLFESVSLGYLSLNVVSLILYRFVVNISPKQMFIVFLIDIIFLHAVFYCSTGITNGLGNLIIISVAAGNIIIRGRIGLSFAALAALLSLFVEIERVLTEFSRYDDIAQSGLMGIMYFSSAYILQHLSIRISEHESLLKKQEQDLLELEKLNHHIIQSMRTGIIVCTKDQHVILMNEACKDLLNPHNNQTLPAPLKERLQQWLVDPSVRTSTFKVSADMPTVQANFSKLQAENNADILIFIEDTRKATQQAQQLKLASLGRLTASIAHEVRNPLGAISHATQLLAESDNLDLSDMKMTDIIQRHSYRVNQIIENTLQLSRRSEPNIDTILIVPWIEKIVHDIHVQKPKKEGTTHTENIIIIAQNTELSARFDASQMEQVMTNLIENALHHGAKNFKDALVFIVINETEDQNQAFIDIIDQGPGINSNNHTHLFEPFFTTETQGTGLGLYLSREICEANQAQLDYLEPNANYSDWQIPPSSQNLDVLALSNERPFGACFRITLAHHNRIL